MELSLSLACSHMMMECPRCGFAQPKDRYCANCGLDVEHFVAKPTPIWLRLAQNSSFHLGLIGTLILVVVGYIFYAQRDLVSREVGHLLKDLPLLSRDSADPNAPPPRKALTPAAPSKEDTATEADARTTAAPNPEPGAAAGAILPTSPSSEKAAEVAQKVEISSWEISREALTTLITSAEKVGESNGGRAYLWSQGAKALEAVQSSGRRLTLSRTMPSQAQAVTTIEAPSAPNDPFQFGLYVQVTKIENKEVTVKWDSNLVMPTPESLTEVTLTGTAALNTNSALIIVIEPPNRTPREEVVAKAGDGPWSILASPEFRGGTSEWIFVVQLH